jgi:hypothetical protein
MRKGTGRRAGAGSRIAYGVLLVALAGGACSRPAMLTQLVDAQARASALHVTLARSIEASNRAVMATDDSTAAEAANDSRNATAAIDRQIPELQQVLQTLTYQIELKRLDGFKARFDEYRRLNDDILSLVLENTNVKAQRLAFGPSADAADGFHEALDAAVAVAQGGETCMAETQAARAWAAVLEIRALYPRHIAEADDAEMTRMETAMAAASTRARTGLEQLTRAGRRRQPPRAGAGGAGPLHGGPHRDPGVVTSEQQRPGPRPRARPQAHGGRRRRGTADRGRRGAQDPRLLRDAMSPAATQPVSLVAKR